MHEEYLMLIFSEHEDQRSSWMVEGSELGSGGGESKDGIPLPPTKPRIWSMAELAVSKSSYVGCGWKVEKPHCWVPSIGTNPPHLPLPSGSPFNAQTRPDSLNSDHSSAKVWAQQRKIRTSALWGWILEADTVNELHLLPKLLTMLLQL